MYFPIIREEDCTKCLACARICPKLVLQENDREVSVAEPSRCTGCKSCSAVCPLNAIQVEEI